MEATDQIISYLAHPVLGGLIAVSLLCAMAILIVRGLRADS